MIETMCLDNDKTRLRLDCGVHLKELRSYYESNGFMNVGQTVVHDESLVLYEKELSPNL